MDIEGLAKNCRTLDDQTPANPFDFLGLINENVFCSRCGDQCGYVGKSVYGSRAVPFCPVCSEDYREWDAEQFTKKFKDILKEMDQLRKHRTKWSDAEEERYWKLYEKLIHRHNRGKFIKQFPIIFIKNKGVV